MQRAYSTQEAANADIQSSIGHSQVMAHRLSIFDTDGSSSNINNNNNNNNINNNDNNNNNNNNNDHNDDTSGS